MDVEIKEFNGDGYMPLVAYNGWRVAILNFMESVREERLHRLERHLETEEVFVLLEGEAILFTGMKLRRCPLKPGRIYNVKCGVWHCIALKENSKVLIVENDSTCGENSEYYCLKSKNRKGD